MSEPREVITTTEWRAHPGIDPRMCRCGHLHYPRDEVLNGVQTRLAPQWTWCEDEQCECRGLRWPARGEQP